MVLLLGTFVLIISCIQPSSHPFAYSKLGQTEVNWLPAVILSLVYLLLVAQMPPPASSSTCEDADKDFSIRRKEASLDPKGMAARYNQICQIQEDYYFNSIFFVIGSRQVAGHLCAMYTSKISSTHIISLTIEELHCLLIGMGG